jgi:multiple sugar transport system ATP-binding protein
METPFEDQEVYVGIRPEGFIVAEEGVLTCQIEQLEVMGRDISIVCKNEACDKPTVRAIVDADTKVALSGSVKFNLKPNKVFLFNKQTEMRLK